MGMPKGFTREEFIRRARGVHGDKYDYGKVDYVNNSTKVIITCPIHGDFTQIPKSHLMGRGCPVCGMERSASKRRGKKGTWKTTERFIEDSRKKYGDRFDYSETVYRGSMVKVQLRCNECGTSFWQFPRDHLEKKYNICCPVCAQKARSDKLRLTLEGFVERAERVHGDGRYDYSEVKYVNAQTKVTVKCNSCGNVFSVTPNSLLSGSGCPTCALGRRADWFRKDKDEFIKDARRIHGDKYDYGKVDYVNARGNITITCPVHGDFLQTPHSHLSGHGCPICGRASASYKRAYSIEEFVERAKAVHGDGYDYSAIKGDRVSPTKKVDIVCKGCGKTFSQQARNHLKGNGCPLCRRSRLEETVMMELDERGIDYVYQYRSPFLGRQSLDFYIEDINVGIEAQGVQHYRPVSFGGHIDKEVFFADNQKRDLKKRALCEENNVKLFYFTTEDGVKEEGCTYTNINSLMDTIETMISSANGSVIETQT